MCANLIPNKIFLPQKEYVGLYVFRPVIYLFARLNATSITLTWRQCADINRPIVISII